LDKLLEITKAHLDSKVTGNFLLYEVLQTSSKEVSKTDLEDICGKVHAMCSDETLLKATNSYDITPTSWLRLLEEATNFPGATLELEDIQELWKKRKEDDVEPNISKDVLEKLEKFISILQSNKLFDEKSDYSHMFVQSDYSEHSSDIYRSLGYGDIAQNNDSHTSTVDVDEVTGDNEFTMEDTKEDISVRTDTINTDGVCIDNSTSEMDSSLATENIASDDEATNISRSDIEEKEKGNNNLTKENVVCLPSTSDQIEKGEIKTILKLFTKSGDVL
jgi:hypothetical protein